MKINIRKVKSVMYCTKSSNQDKAFKIRRLTVSW